MKTWQETVLSIEDIHRFPRTGEELKEALLDQADVTGYIAFKAGYEKGLSERTFNQWGQETTDLEVRREAMREGMMKVVEWGNEPCCQENHPHFYKRRHCPQCWQAFLKEQGIQEGQ